MRQTEGGDRCDVGNGRCSYSKTIEPARTKRFSDKTYVKHQRLGVEATISDVNTETNMWPYERTHFFISLPLARNLQNAIRQRRLCAVFAASFLTITR